MMASNGDNANLMELISMGFDPIQCQSALDLTGGNLEQAVNYLLTGEAPPSAGNPPPPNASSLWSTPSLPVRMVHGPISQYSVENGRSACTCIALRAASDVLVQLSNNSTSSGSGSGSLETILTVTFLQMSIVLGVETYDNLKVVDAGMEHKSAEEVLATGSYPSLSQDGPVLQGMLSSTSPPEQQPLGLYTLLSASQDSTNWTCVLITKPPETVLVVLPPTTTTTTTTSPPSYSFALIDSHPRPQQFQAQQSYARLHANLHDLVISLNAIFPCAQLGPDIPELMAAMYNQFDLYRFRRQSSSSSTPGSS
mmetsp:Transcript_3619/g.9987  ORF Transcript_3619/g.9987 Transcript_3619/m.9987 type:complete len:310 (+) Transcript_3619:20-949(+)